MADYLTDELEADRGARGARARGGVSSFGPGHRSPQDEPEAQEPLAQALRRIRERNRAELGLAGLGAASVLASAVDRITVRTTATPAYTYVPGSAAGPQQDGGSFGAWILSLLKPDVEVQTAFGTARYAPYGQVTESYWPWVAGGLAVGGAGLGYVLVRGLLAIAHGRRLRLTEAGAAKGRHGRRRGGR